MVIAALVTAFSGIYALRWLGDKTSENSQNTQNQENIKTPQKLDIAELDAKSMVLPGTPVTDSELQARQIPYIPVNPQPLTPEELTIAQVAWTYFVNNWNEKTGLVNSADGFPSVTLWDQSAALAALVSAKELKLITETEFKAKMTQSLATLAKLPLYNKELPNKVYNSQTLIPVNYGQLEKKEEIGWSAIDIGRMAIWLKIIGTKYPEFQPAVTKIWDSWNVKRLTKEGQMYGTSVIDGKEQYNQEGRLGYENYAAFGLKLWGLDVSKALDYQEKTAFVNLYGVGIPYDKRDQANSGANNYVLSEPFILDGIETGFQSLPKPFSDRILSAQEARYQDTKQLTALTEDNLDREPYFTYNTLFVNGTPWATITDTGKNYNHLRFLSTKAALGWYILYDGEYTEKLYQFVRDNLQGEGGWYNGYYESLPEVNQALTANNNGVILQSLLYKQVGKPLLIWAQNN